MYKENKQIYLEQKHEHVNIIRTPNRSIRERIKVAPHIKKAKKNNKKKIAEY